MQSFNLINELENEEKFRNDVKYSRQLPEMFSTEDINAASENITFAILGELRDRYNGKEPVTFSYQELAELGGLWVTRKNGTKNLYNGKRLQKIMYELNDALKNFSYYQVRETNEDGTPKSWKTINIFSIIDFDGTKKEVKLTLSDAVINPQQVDAQGNIIDKPLHVYDLINSKDWRTVKHLQYSRGINNSLPSKYSKRIYRFISEFRSFPKGTKMRIDDFDKKILKILKTEEEVFSKTAEVFDLRKNRKKYLETGVKEISELKTATGEQIVKNLDYIYHMSGRRIQSIEFTFTPFSADLTGNTSISLTKRTSSGKTSPFIDDARIVLEYFNYLSKINFELDKNGVIKHQANYYEIQFDLNDTQLLQPIHKLLESGVTIDELLQVSEMKAIDWKLNSPQMINNFRPSVVFGNKFSEYRAFLMTFKAQNMDKLLYDNSSDFYIPLDGPWNKS
ncbi:replication initiation protein [Lactococcus lactis]|uniref:RepB family plasmid replication initiator protein n=2 Tax=Bacilli TaxID=91061 RepID=A0AAP8DZC6_9LACT|nr:replication initiation protein [Lactococcus lactis]MDG4972500.1 replication initiation protein [Lactococcus lactis]PFG87313.1 RepB family plasmid replication initiator protein [Lactococcus lactis]